MNHKHRSIGRRWALTPIGAALAALTILGCGGAETATDPGAGNPASAARDYERALADAPPALAELYGEGDVLLDGGLDTYREQLVELRGHPVVVNVWASWCGPCRAEFPYFQSQAAKRGEQIAFLGVDVEDSEDAARTFLDEYPVPYPSVSDPDADVQRELDLVGLPGTAFYDEQGERVFLKQGEYRSEGDLAADIQRYAG